MTERVRPLLAPGFSTFPPEGVGCLAQPDPGWPQRNEDRMTKRSRREREQRAEQNERIRAIEASMLSRIDPTTAQAFARSVAEARARGPELRPPDMPPGTAPRPPRPGHEPRPAKEAARPRRDKF
jgi:hypothetical protein